MANEQPVLVISYSPQEDWAAQRLRKHCRPLLRDSSIFLNMVPEYRERDREQPAVTALKGARAIVPLISADYLASDFVMEVAVPAFEECQRLGALVLPVIVGHSAFVHVAAFTQFRPIK
jgi:hypothetical protein